MTPAEHITDEKLDEVRQWVDRWGSPSNVRLDLLSLLTELQHRRAEEAGTPDGWVLVPRERTEEMHRGAQGTTGAVITHGHSDDIWNAMVKAAPKPNHIGGRLICEALGFDPTNHHNAAKCLYCTPASGVRVKALEWVNLIPQRSEVKSIVGLYFAYDDGSWTSPKTGHHFVSGTMETAKASAQADYEARILSALGEQP